MIARYVQPHSREYATAAFYVGKTYIGFGETPEQADADCVTQIRRVWHSVGRADLVALVQEPYAMPIMQAPTAKLGKAEFQSLRRAAF